MDDEDRERLFNMAVFHIPLTHAEIAAAGPLALVLLGILIAVAVVAVSIWS